MQITFTFIYDCNMDMNTGSRSTRYYMCGYSCMHAYIYVHACLSMHACLCMHACRYFVITVCVLVVVVVCNRCVRTLRLELFVGSG